MCVGEGVASVWQLFFFFFRVNRALRGNQSRPVVPCHTSSKASPFSSYLTLSKQSLFSSASSILEPAYPWMPRAHPHVRNSNFIQQRCAAWSSLDEGHSLFSWEVWKKNLGAQFWNTSCCLLISETRLPYSWAYCEVWSAAAYLHAHFLHIAGAMLVHNMTNVFDCRWTNCSEGLSLGHFGKSGCQVGLTGVQWSCPGKPISTLCFQYHLLGTNTEIMLLRPFKQLLFLFVVAVYHLVSLIMS